MPDEVDITTQADFGQGFRVFLDVNKGTTRRVPASNDIATETVEYKIAQCMKCGSDNVSTDTRRDGLNASVKVHCLECDWDTCFDMVFNPPAATGMPLGVEGKYIDDAG